VVATEGVRTHGTPLTPEGALRGGQALRHHANAILREDSRGARRIDGAVAAVMAVHRAAELAGAPRLDIYI
jgi:hypothetical protein